MKYADVIINGLCEVIINKDDEIACLQAENERLTKLAREQQTKFNTIRKELN